MSIPLAPLFQETKKLSISAVATGKSCEDCPVCAATILTKMIVADTSPLNYLVLIHQINLFPDMYGRVQLSGT